MSTGSQTVVVEAFAGRVEGKSRIKVARSEILAIRFNASSRDFLVGVTKVYPAITSTQPLGSCPKGPIKALTYPWVASFWGTVSA
jgi:hypothetical protein